MSSLVHYYDDDGDDDDDDEKQKEEEEQQKQEGQQEEEAFIGIIFASTNFSYLFLFLKPSLQPLTPNLEVTVHFLFSLRFLELN